MVKYNITKPGKNLILEVTREYDPGVKNLYYKLKNSKLIQLLDLIDNGQNDLKTLEDELYGHWSQKNRRKKILRSLIEESIEAGYIVQIGKEHKIPLPEPLPSFYKIDNIDLFENPVRKGIFDYVNKHPGASYSEIQISKKLCTGVANYHLKVLVKKGLLDTRREGSYRIFYRPEHKHRVNTDKSKARKKILSIIKRYPGINVKDLAKKIGGAGRLYQHLQKLHEADKITKKRVGKHNELFIKED